MKEQHFPKLLFSSVHVDSHSFLQIRPSFLLAPLKRYSSCYMLLAMDSFRFFLLAPSPPGAAIAGECDFPWIGTRGDALRLLLRPGPCCFCMCAVWILCELDLGSQQCFSCWKMLGVDFLYR